MNILIILPRFHTNYVGAIKALKNQGYNIKLLVYNFGFTENYSDIKPIYLKENIITKFINVFFNSKLNEFYLPNISIFKRLIKNYNPDVIIIRPYNKLFSLYLICLRLFYNFQLIFYNQTNNKNLDKFNFSLKFIQFFFINKIFNIKIYSPIITKIKKLYFKKIYFLPFVSKISLKIKKNNSKTNTFLMIGKFVKKKNYEMFLKSLKNLDKRFKIKATLVGEVSTIEQEKEYMRIKNLIEKYDLKKKIQILKNIDHKNISNYYKRNDFLVLPTSGDLAPITVVEALGYGCMVLCSTSCGTKNYIRKGLNGFIFDDNNQKSLDKFMIKLIKNKKNYKKNFINNKILMTNLIGEKNFIKKFKRMIEN